MDLSHAIEHKIEFISWFSETDFAVDQTAFAQLHQLNSIVNAEIANFVPIPKSFTVLPDQAKPLLARAWEQFTKKKLV